MLKKYSVVVIALVCMITACSYFQGEDAKSWGNMSTKEKAVFLMTLYNKQYDEYIVLYKQPDKTEAQKEALKKKYEWLNKVYPYIDTYATYAENNVVPPSDVELLIIQLINEVLGI